MERKQLDLPQVRRIYTYTGSRIEPPLNQAWTQSERLAWQAAVCAHDTCLDIQVWHDPPGFNLVITGPHGGNSSISRLSYDEAGTYLNGIRTGVDVLSTINPEPDDSD